ncbi:MAG TPA: hypothetical protein VHY77_06225 [Acidimicrobiales bacterium]|nr:hypothetical protein [Acidimicrobiales bacterium]
MAMSPGPQPSIGTPDSTTDSDASRRRIVAFLRDGGADAILHPHGTLFEHLVGTEQLLRAWGCSDTVSLAGLAHAVYGTDGFSPHLLDWHERQQLVDLAGPEVESLVYLYACCDRAAVYPQLDRPGPVAFPDRFSGCTLEPSEAAVRDFVDLTLANETEIAVLGREGAAPRWLLDLFDQSRRRASTAARRGAGALLGPTQSTRSSIGGAGGTDV